MKIAIIGGGSTYTPELVKGFLSSLEHFPLNELWLMDIDPYRLNIIGEFSKRMVISKNSPLKIILTTNQQEAIHGASYVITQLRIGQMEARKKDEYLGQRHGLIGQETTGIGGMAKALRTIPVILGIAEDMKIFAPGSLMVNFTNPSGMMTQALIKYAKDIQSVGICNTPFTTKMRILNQLEKETGRRIDPARSELNTLGLNHLSWHRGFTIDGKEIWPRVISLYIKHLKAEKEPEWDPDLIETLRMIPNQYLQYYYYTDRKLEIQKNWPPSRAEEVIEIENLLLSDYANPNLLEPPISLLKRGGANYSTVAIQLIKAHFNDLREIHVVNIQNQGAVKEWPAEWVLEMPARVDHSGLHPIPTEPLPEVCFGLISQVKAFELLTIDAAVKGDRKLSIQALLAHPLGPKSEQVSMVLEDMLETNRSYLPRFSK